MAGKAKEKPPSLKSFKFKKHQTIGAVDALEDRSYLKNCFVDTGEMEILLDTQNPKCIILGRTGSGKTALIERLCQTRQTVIQLSPQELALTYLSNNEVLKFYLEIGVNMELFFSLLWKHIFAVEIIKAYFDVTNEVKATNFFSDLRQRVFKRKSMELGRSYLLDWGQSFWKETDYRVKEYTTTMENELQIATNASLEAAIPGLGTGKVELGPHVARKLTEEQKAEIVRYGQRVVDARQIQQMTEVINMLKEELLDDDQKRYYITIDRLDENWVNDNLRYRLIRSLFETIREFNYKLPNVKIIAAIREDLLIRVFRYTRDTGDQGEKYQSLFVGLRWKPDELEDVLDRRVNQLITHQYTGAQVSVKDLLPTRVGSAKEDALKYMLDRTMMTPREVIMFFNECIKGAEGKAAINQTNLFTAEGIYSEYRLSAIANEWSADYPNLIPVVFLLKKQKKTFKLDDIDMRVLEKFLLDFWAQYNDKQDFIYKLVEEKLYGDANGLLRALLKIFYRVGIVGIKNESYQQPSWSYTGAEAETDDNSSFYIHPAFWRALGVVP